MVDMVECTKLDLRLQHVEEKIDELVKFKANLTRYIILAVLFSNYSATILAKFSSDDVINLIKFILH